MSTGTPVAAKGETSRAADPKAGDSKPATDPKAHDLPNHPVKGEVPGGEAAKQAEQSQAAEQQKAAPQVIATAARSIELARKVIVAAIQAGRKSRIP